MFGSFLPTFDELFPSSGGLSQAVQQALEELSSELRGDGPSDLRDSMIITQTSNSVDSLYAYGHKWIKRATYPSVTWSYPAVCAIADNLTIASDKDHLVSPDDAIDPTWFVIYKKA